MRFRRNLLQIRCGNFWLILISSICVVVIKRAFIQTSMEMLVDMTHNVPFDPLDWIMTHFFVKPFFTSIKRAFTELVIIRTFIHFIELLMKIHFIVIMRECAIISVRTATRIKPLCIPIIIDFGTWLDGVTMGPWSASIHIDIMIIHTIDAFLTFNNTVSS